MVKKGKGEKMELCENFYEERFSEDVLSRIVKAFLVLLIFCAMAANTDYNNPPAGKSISSDIAPAETDMAETGDDAGFDAIISEVFDPMMLTAEQTALKPPVPAAADDTTAAEPAAVITDIQNNVTEAPVESMAAIPDKPADIASEVPADIIPEEPVAITPEEPENVVAEEPAVPVPPADETSENIAGTIDGFLVTDSGIIYGISDPGLVISDGYMELPDTGCTGIAAGTFSGGFPAVREVFIPANITYIEEGAFTGLTNMEWFEMETAGDYYTEEGVLFSENGTCLLAFPAGRTGNYKVPSHVVRFAAGAFDSAQIDTLDATACSLGDVSGIPENISLLTRETP